MFNNATDQTVGRTPWDFATAVLMRLGPTTVVVIGLLGFAYFLYTEINTARLETNKQLQNSIEVAQQQLVDNTIKMGDMSEKLIININNMLELSEKVDKKIDESREIYQKQLNKIQKEMEDSTKRLEESERQVKVARTEIVHLTEELEKKQAKMNALENTHKKLSVDVSILKAKKKELEGSTRAYARQVGELKEGLTVTLADVLGKVKDEEIKSSVRSILTVFVAEPGSPQTQNSLGELIGLRESILEKAIGEDGVGFETWFYIEDPDTGVKNTFGYVKQMQDGPRHVLVIDSQDDRIYRTSYGVENLLFKIPTAENWYERWMCNFVIFLDNEFEATYSVTDMNAWNQISLSVRPERS